MQSAGNNKYIRTSEATRETSDNRFNEFQKVYKVYLNKDFTGTDTWLDWFIGFVEGDGSILGYPNRNIVQFVITQKERKILLEIKQMLQMG